MAPSKIKKALGAVKDQTTISLAKVGSSTSLADLEVAIVKATRHNEHPAEDKYIREILSLTCYSRTYISACVNMLSKRLNKTQNWTVAMKTLILIQRLLYEGDPAYEPEIFFSTRRGTRILNMSDFRDHGKSNSWDFSAFVRTYALYLDERLEYRMQNQRGKKSTFGSDEEDDENKDKEKDKDKQKVKEKEKEKESVMRSTPIRDTKTEQIFSKMQHLQLLLERFLACRPTGAAKTHRIVIVSLYALVKDSFQMYRDITEILDTLLDRFADLEMQECNKVYDMFCRVGKQFDDLDLFYCWCKSMGIARSSEYPQIEKITSKQLEIMDDYIKEKSAALQGKASKEEKNEEEEATVEELEEDVNAIKALPPPEEEPKAEQVIEEPIKQEPKEQEQKEADLLHLGDDLPSTEEQGDKLALALFDGAAPATASTMQALPWHAFDEEADWETALVQSTSNLANQKPELGGGFDTLLLNGMYKQAEVNAAMQGPGSGVSGSASSMALGSAGRPAMLALPAPPSSGGGGADLGTASTDPFAASLGVAPPSYVQMTEMEKKQRLLMEEQALWQQYTREGMRGESALSRLERNAYMGTYAQPNPGSNYR